MRLWGIVVVSSAALFVAALVRPFQDPWNWVALISSAVAAVAGMTAAVRSWLAIRRNAPPRDRDGPGPP